MALSSVGIMGVCHFAVHDFNFNVIHTFAEMILLLYNTACVRSPLLQIYSILIPFIHFPH